MNKKIRLLLSCIVVITFAACGGGGGGDSGGGGTGGGGGGGPGGGGGGTTPVTKASNDIANTDVDTAVTIDVLTNDTVVDGGTLSITNKTDGTSGAVMINADNTLTYTPNSGFNGTDTFTYTASDGKGGTSSAMVTVHVGTPPNSDPVAVDDSTNTPKDMPINISVLINDSDPDSDPLTVTDVTQGSNGSVVINSDNTVTYSPNSGYVGIDSFTYSISDGKGGTSTATVSVDVKKAVIGDGGPYFPITVYDDMHTVVALKVMDIQSPYTMTTLENTTVDQINTFDQYDYNTTTQVISNGKPRYLFYWKDNHFWRVSLAFGSDLVAQQVASDTFTNICGDVSIQNHGLDPLTTAIIIETAGANGGCYGTEEADNVFHLIRLGFSATDAAINGTNIIPFFGHQIKVLDDGFLTVVNNTLRYYDANLANPIDLISVTDPMSVFFGDAFNQDSFVFVDNELRWFNGTTHTLGGSLRIMASSYPDDFLCDKVNCYFAEFQVDSTYSIYTVPADGSGGATLLTGGIDSSSINLNLTANYIFYVVDNLVDSTDELYRFPKIPAVTDTPFLVDAADIMSFTFTNLNFIYYDKKTKGDTGITDSTAIINNETLSNMQSFTNSLWLGLADYVFSYADGSIDASIFLANGPTDITKGVAGASLQVYSIGTGIIQSTIGTIPAGVFSLSMFNSSLYGDIRIAFGNTASTSTTSGYQSDIFIINPSATDAITNQTNTTDVHEYPAF